MNDENAPWASRVAAANGLLDRAWGKPKEYLQLDGESGTALLRITFVDAGDASNMTIQAPTVASETTLKRKDSDDDGRLRLSFDGDQ